MKKIFFACFLIFQSSYSIETEKGMLKFYSTINWEKFWGSFKFDFFGCDCPPFYLKDWCEFFFCDFLPAIEEEHIEPFAAFSSSPEPFDFVGLGIKGGGKVFGVSKGVTRRSSGSGSSGENTDETKESTSFRQINLMPFPIAGMIAFFDVTNTICLASGNVNSMYISDIDPLYANEGLNNLWTLIKTPSRLLDLLLPIWELRCVVDCLSSTFNYPLDSFYTCNGCRGGIGSQDTGWVKNNDPMENSEMLAFKLLNNLHERAALYDVSSNSCTNNTKLNIKKSQYKISFGATSNNAPFYMGRMRFMDYDFKESFKGKDSYFFWIWKKRKFCGFYERLCQDNLPL
ncbi:hypothetical protein CQA57_06980 [Helicobacter anseris]|uniref:Uncharacterized protein n=1 Tax=Helicobacter anseris TaxID=375926 RepID=A0A3D8J4C7_9HELI|nr:TraU family protein [Helicobacter anseris]RDU72339.1 hypothetical protein CQA57_06980 [Helicobacter anseris]